MKGLSQRSGVLCGLAAVVGFSALYSTAVVLDQSYSFGENYLSDLGVGEGAWAFNSGAVLAGVLLVPFSIYGLGPSLGKGVAGRVGTALMSLSGMFLAAVGVFNEDYDPAHLVVSVSFFLSLLAALGAVTFALYRTNSLGRFGRGVSLGAFALGAGLLLGGGTPLVETIAVLAAMAWGLLISAALLIRTRPRKAP